MKHISEYVSLGHPDKVADFISQYLLDRYIEQDPETRYAVEVQIKNNIVTLGGEVSSRAKLSSEDIEAHVREAVRQIGYTGDYEALWGHKNVTCADNLIVYSFIGQQSPDIARGLSGWGDQGIFFGYAEPSWERRFMPSDHYLAQQLCHELFISGVGGLDIKTQVVLDDDRVEKVIAAVPLVSPEAQEQVGIIIGEVLKGWKLSEDFEVIINGTGSYVRHGSWADCGTTGRKLAVDFYGGNGRIGGGSPWTKDGSKADLTLNLLARNIAIAQAVEYDVPVQVALGCCIGRQTVDISVQDTAGNVLVEGSERIDPTALRLAYGLGMPIYASMCRWGLFGQYQRDKIWETPLLPEFIKL